jgi:acetyl-CoA synthetase
MKPGSCGPMTLGIYAEILDENSEPIERGSGRAGNITIRKPWPRVFETIWGQPDRFVQTYYAKYNRDPNSTDWHDWPYFAGDGAVQAADGYFRILGRVDVINVAGHGLGTKETGVVGAVGRGGRGSSRGPRHRRRARPGG